MREEPDRSSLYSPTPERFREDSDPEPYEDPLSGVTYPVQARDVLDADEFREYQRERRLKR